MISAILSESKPASGAPMVLHLSNGLPSTGTVFVMNQGDDNDRVSVALVTSGNSLSSGSYICYQSVLHRGHSLYLQQICLGSGDEVSVTSENGTSSFIFTGNYDQ